MDKRALLNLYLRAGKTPRSPLRLTITFYSIALFDKINFPQTYLLLETFLIDCEDCSIDRLDTTLDMYDEGFKTFIIDFIKSNHVSENLCTLSNRLTGSYLTENFDYNI